MLFASNHSDIKNIFSSAGATYYPSEDIVWVNWKMAPLGNTQTRPLPPLHSCVTLCLVTPQPAPIFVSRVSHCFYLIFPSAWAIFFSKCNPPSSTSTFLGPTFFAAGFLMCWPSWIRISEYFIDRTIFYWTNFYISLPSTNSKQCLSIKQWNDVKSLLANFQLKLCPSGCFHEITFNAMSYNVMQCQSTVTNVMFIW